MPSMLKWLDSHLEEAILVFFLILISVVMFLQIIMRFLFGAPLVWPEEFCRYCFVVSAMLTTGYCIRHNKMLRVDVVIGLFPQKMTVVLDIASSILALVFCCIMISPAWTVAMGALKISQVSPAMEMPVWLLYASAPLGFAIGAVRSIQALVLKVLSYRKQSAAGME